LRYSISSVLGSHITTAPTVEVSGRIGRDVFRISKAAPKLQSIALAGAEMKDATPFATDAEGVWINTATRCGMSDSGRAYSYLRSVSLVALDALGRPNRVGHYIDFWSAAIGLTLFPLGYLLDALTKPRV
jgi:hypothetical protein